MGIILTLVVEEIKKTSPENQGSDDRIFCPPNGFMKIPTSLCIFPMFCRNWFGNGGMCNKVI